MSRSSRQRSIMAVETIDLEGWKGDGELSFTQKGDGYIVREPRKTKEGGAVEFLEHFVPLANVSLLRQIIRLHCDMATKYGYKWLVRKVIELYNIHITESLSIEQMMEAFNGGKYRAKYYFPYLYYPLKVLEAKKEITYYGRGGITRLK